MRRAPSWVTIERVSRFSLGVALIAWHGFAKEVPSRDVLATGLALLALPDLVRFDRWLDRMRGDEKAER